MFLLVISVNHTIPILKVSTRILLLGKCSFSILFGTTHIITHDKQSSNETIALWITESVDGKWPAIPYWLWLQTNELLTERMLPINNWELIWARDLDGRVNCKKAYSNGVQLALTISRIQYGSHLRSANAFLQLTHSMLPLSLLILGCYTCSNRWVLDITWLATLSRDNGSSNIECTSSYDDVSPSILYTTNMYLSNDEECFMMTKIDNAIWTNEGEDLYSHQYGLETIKTISNRCITQNNIIPLINGTGSIVPVMILFCIRDSLREYKSNYVILNTIKISLIYWCILTESAIFNLLFWTSHNQVLSPLLMMSNLCLMIICRNSYDISLKNTNMLSNSATIMTNWYLLGIGLIQWYLCSYLFIEDQMNELTCLICNHNDTLDNSCFYNIDSWHLYHIILGNGFIAFIWYLWSNSCYMMCLWINALRIRLHHMLYNMQLVYWHFVELLWLVIYYVLYS